MKYKKLALADYARATPIIHHIHAYGVRFSNLS